MKWLVALVVCILLPAYGQSRSLRDDYPELEEHLDLARKSLLGCSSNSTGSGGGSGDLLFAPIKIVGNLLSLIPKLLSAVLGGLVTASITLANKLCLGLGGLANLPIKIVNGLSSVASKLIGTLLNIPFNFINSLCGGGKDLIDNLINLPLQFLGTANNGGGSGSTGAPTDPIEALAGPFLDILKNLFGSLTGSPSGNLGVSASVNGNIGATGGANGTAGAGGNAGAGGTAGASANAGASGNFGGGSP